MSMATAHRILFCIIALLSFISSNGAVVHRSDTLISLITCHAGPEIYELEGHSGVRIATPAYDYVLNYGLFDFNAPGFVYRFVKGETDYFVGIADFNSFVQSYAAQGRRVVEQQLDLTGEEKSNIIDLAQKALLPENRVYRYNYVKDNCSTRCLQLIEAAVGDTLTFKRGDGMPENTTFRREMKRFHGSYPWYQFGIDMALGKGIDYPLALRERAFAPVTLQYLMDSASLACHDGMPRNIVGQTVELFPGIDGGASLPSTPWWATPFVAAVVLFLLSVSITVRDISRQRVSRWFDSLLFGIVGLSGFLLTFLIFVSVHEATSPNYLYMWLNPFVLVISVAVWIKSAKNVVLCCHFINFALVSLMAVLWPFLSQCGNWAFIPLIAADLLRSVNYIYINCVKNPTGNTRR